MNLRGINKQKYLIGYSPTLRMKYFLVFTFNDASIGLNISNCSKTLVKQLKIT